MYLEPIKIPLKRIHDAIPGLVDNPDGVSEHALSKKSPCGKYTFCLRRQAGRWFGSVYMIGVYGPTDVLPAERLWDLQDIKDFAAPSTYGLKTGVPKWAAIDWTSNGK